MPTILFSHDNYLTKTVIGTSQ